MERNMSITSFVAWQSVVDEVYGIDQFDAFFLAPVR